MSAFQSVPFRSKIFINDHSCCFTSVLFIQIREIGQRAFQWSVFIKFVLSKWHWKACDHMEVVYVLHLTIVYQSHQVLDSLCSLSQLAPWLPQLTQTVNEVHKKQQGSSVPLLIFNNVLPPNHVMSCWKTQGVWLQPGPPRWKVLSNAVSFQAFGKWKLAK